MDGNYLRHETTQMSLVPTYVLAVDGNYYENPTIAGEMDGHWWHICFDDDDPAELVAREVWTDEIHDFTIKVLKSLGFEYKLERKSTCSREDKKSYVMRSFPQDNYKKMYYASAYFFEPRTPIPVPQGQTPATNRGQGVYYTFGTRLHT
jgi:hypothetical protein